jgi:hypothetical protein
MTEAPANILKGLSGRTNQHIELRPEAVIVEHEGQPMDLTGCQRMIVYRDQIGTKGPKTYVELQFNKKTKTYRLDAAHNPTVVITPREQ